MPREVVYERPWLYPKQKEALFHDHRYSVVEASTKSGKTVGCMVWLTEQAMKGREGRNYWWIAPVYGQARMVFDRLKRAIPSELYEDNKTDLTITLANGAVIWFKTGEKPDNLYGEDVHAAVIDEATRCREESWHAIRSTLTKTKGPVRVIGNVKGRKNWAYRLARKAEAGEPNMHYAKITAWDAVEAGVLDEEEIEDARRQLPEDVFQQLYLAEAADDEGNPFGIQAIRSCIGPVSKYDPVVWGWDIAKHVNYTVGIGLDADGRVSAFERDRMPWNETLRWIIEKTGEMPAVVDSTGPGDMPVETLQREGGAHFEPFRFTSKSKQQIMEGLAVAIQQGDLTFPEGPITSELESFEYEYTRTGVRYSPPEGMHDDCVDALALVNWLWQQHYKGPEPAEVTFTFEESGGFVL